MSDQNHRDPEDPARSIVVASWGQVRDRRCGIAGNGRRGLGADCVEVHAVDAAAQAEAGQDRRRGVDPQSWNVAAREPRSAASASPGANGVRYVDTAHSYGSEPAIARWLKTARRDSQRAVPRHQGHAEHAARADRRSSTSASRASDRLRRPDLHPRCGRSANTEHAGRVAGEPGVQGNRRGDPQVRQGEVRRLLDAPPATAGDLAECRSKGVSSTRSCCRIIPGVPRKTHMNRALDACHKAGIGLISMKQVAGNVNLDYDRPRASRAQGKGAEAVSGPAARDLDRRAVFVVLRVDAEYRPGSRERRGGPDVQAAEAGRDGPDARRLHRRRPDHVRRLRRPVQPRGRHHGRAGQPDAVPHVSRASRRPRAKPGGTTPSCPRLPATGPAPTSKPPAQACPSKLDFASLLPKADRLLG